MHLICPKILHKHCFGCNTQEKMKNKPMQNLGGGGGKKGELGEMWKWRTIFFPVPSNSPMQKSSLKISSTQCP